MEVMSGNPRSDVTARKKRSSISRKPRPDQSLLILDSRSHSDDVIKGFNDENSSDGKKINQNGFSDHTRKRIKDLSAERLDIDGNSKEVKNLKLKVCGIPRTIKSKSIADNVTGPDSSSTPRQKLLPQDHSNGHQGDQSDDPVPKTKRVPKKRVLDEAFDEEYDDEIGYLQNLKISKAAYAKKSLEQDSSNKKLPPISKVYKNGKHDDARKKRPRSTDTDYKEEDEDEEEAVVSDCKKQKKKQRKKQKKKQKKEQPDLTNESKREHALTTRQRALLSSSSSNIEFPNGLPPAPSRKQKEKLSDMEQQLKKAEAAQRRKLKVEKAARETEAEAIKKILGQGTNKKKREEKAKKRLEELAQEKVANAEKLASTAVRWIIGPNGTTVTFPDEIGLPSIFDPKPKGYPPPRETCAGPSCSNPYKYRHSKSNLPLCSLKCYKAVDSLETIS